MPAEAHRVMPSGCRIVLARPPVSSQRRCSLSKGRFMLPRLLTLASTGWLIALPHLAQAQQPLIDAGQQAMIQHYNNLIEQQSAPDQEEAAEEARRARGRGEAPEAAIDERC